MEELLRQLGREKDIARLSKEEREAELKPVTVEQLLVAYGREGELSRLSKKERERPASSNDYHELSGTDPIFSLAGAFHTMAHAHGAGDMLYPKDDVLMHLPFGEIFSYPSQFFYKMPGYEGPRSEYHGKGRR